MRRDDDIRKRIAEQASEWLAAYRAGTLKESERRALWGWLKASPQNVEEFLGVAASEESLAAAASKDNTSVDDLVAAARASADDNVVSMAPSNRAARPSRLGTARWALAIAAGCAGVVFSGWWLWLSHVGEGSGVQLAYQTVRAARLTRSLPDGSSFELDADSAMTVRFGDKERAVDLSRGRAFFTVAHGSNRPFKVTAGTTTIVAVGTQFEIDMLRSSTVVTVIEGRVLVSQSPGAHSGGAGDGGNTAVPVGANQQIRVDPNFSQSVAVRVDLAQAQAWRHGKIVFDNHPLSDVAEEFNRYASVPIEVADSTLGSTRLSGVFDSNDSESFIQFLQSVEGVVADRTAERVRISRGRGASSH